jgi:uncharacterized membrane protein
MIIAIAVHILASVIWVGGMFFAHVILRPSAGPLDQAQRLALWHRVLSRFFPWVWLAVAALLVSGFAMIFLEFGGFAATGSHVRIMMTVGIIMMLIFAHLYFAPWKRLRGAVQASDWADAERRIGQIRVLITVNLALGLAVVMIGASGRFW